MATDLFTAIKGGDGAAVERLLETDRGLVDARDQEGLSPILAALYRGRSEIAVAILRRGPKLNVFEAATAGDLARLELLMKHRADPSIRNNEGKTPQDIAAERGHADVARALASR